MRYTRFDLDLDLIKINGKLAASKTDYRFRADYHSGYTGVNLYKGNRYIQLIANGVPKDCKAMVFEWVITNSDSFNLKD